MTTKNNRPKYINVLASSTLAFSLFAGVAVPNAGAEAVKTTHYSATTEKDFLKDLNGLKLTTEKFEERILELESDLDYQTHITSSADTTTIKNANKAKLDQLKGAIEAVRTYDKLKDTKAISEALKTNFKADFKGATTTAEVANVIKAAQTSLDTAYLNDINKLGDLTSGDATFYKPLTNKIKSIKKLADQREKDFTNLYKVDNFIALAATAPTEAKKLKEAKPKTIADLETNKDKTYNAAEAKAITAAINEYNTIKKSKEADIKNALKTSEIKDLYKALSTVQKDYLVQEKLQVKVITTDINKLKRKDPTYVASVDAAQITVNELKESNEALYSAIKPATLDKLKGHVAAVAFLSTIDTAYTQTIEHTELAASADTAGVKLAISLLSKEDLVEFEKKFTAIEDASKAKLDDNEKINKAAQGLIKADLKAIADIQKLIDARKTALAKANIEENWAPALSDLINATIEQPLDAKKNFKDFKEPELIKHLQDYESVKGTVQYARETFNALTKDEQKLIPKEEQKILKDAEGYFKKELGAVKSLFKSKITDLNKSINNLKTSNTTYTADYDKVLAEMTTNWENEPNSGDGDKPSEAWSTWTDNETKKHAIRSALSASAITKFVNHTAVQDFVTNFKAGNQLASDSTGKVVLEKDYIYLGNDEVIVNTAATVDAATLKFELQQAKDLISATTKDAATIKTYKDQVNLYIKFYESAFGIYEQYNKETNKWEDKIDPKAAKAQKALVSSQYKTLTAMKKELEKAQ